MTKQTEAMKLALEALENSVDLVSHEARNAEELYGKYPTRLARIQGLVALKVAHEKAINALREALAEQPAQQEPVATVIGKFLTRKDELRTCIEPELPFGTKLYTSPPTLSLAQRNPLTDKEIDSFRETNSEGRGAGWRFNFKGFARAIEAAHGIKENT